VKRNEFYCSHLGKRQCLRALYFCIFTPRSVCDFVLTKTDCSLSPLAAVYWELKVNSQADSISHLVLAKCFTLGRHPIPTYLSLLRAQGVRSRRAKALLSTVGTFHPLA
jgi:hypothetical protein